MNLKISCLVFFLFFSFSAWPEGKNYYDILGVSRTATQEQIKTAYRELARKWHPDRHPEPEDNRRATEKFQEINRAYETLKSPLERRRYDQFGHETWTSSSETQTRDFYSEAFTDVFNRTDNVSSRPISQKSVYLFKKLTLLQNSKAANERDFTLSDALLRRLLAEFKISDFNTAKRKKTRERILQAVASYSQEVKNIIGLSEIEEKKEEYLKQSLRKFITEVENRYLVEEITSRERQAIELFYQFSFFNQSLNDFLAKQKRKLELLQKEQEEQLTKEEKQELDRFQKEERKDLRVFRKILSSLALPGQTHHEFLLRNYLDAFKNSLFNEKFGEKLLTVETHSAQQRFYMEDREIIKALKNVKTSFDNIHYENLRSMSNPFKLNFLKSFPVQFIIFQAAIGASLYRQSITDPYFYGAERNPELLSETMKHTLTPTGVASFFIFVAVSQQMNYRLYGLGRLLDGKSLAGAGKLGRAIAPGAGLGLGFFVSVLFDELIRDPHLVKCAKSLYKEAPAELTRDHISPCESFYNNWSRSEKWMHYGVDIITLIGAGVLSHKFLTAVLNGVRLTAWGSNLLIGLTRTVGLRITGWAGFFVHMFFFMEFHKLLDVLIGQPLKEQLSAGSVKNSLVELTEYLNQDLNAISSLGAYLQNNQGVELEEYLSEQFKKSTAGIKALGVKFQGWANIAGQTYNQSAGLWMQNINKLLSPYEASSLLLKDLFISAQFVYNSDISMAQNWDSQQEVTEDNREYWYRLNRGSWFDSRIIEFNKESYQEKHCPQVSEELPFWNNFCSHSEGFFGSEEFSEEFNGYLFRETAELIYRHLKSISLEKSYEINPIHYVGLGEDELFSSDPQYSLKELNYEIVKYPNQEIKRLSYDKEFELSRQLIKAGLDWESSLLSLGADQISELKSSLCAGYFPDYKTNPESEELYLYCYNSSSYLTEIKDLCHSWYPDDPGVYEQCIELFHSTERELQWNFGLKLLSAGIYLLKDIIFKLDERGPIEISFLEGNPVISDIWIVQPIFDLLESMKVYKKGEQKFLLTQENFIRQKNQLETDQEKDMLETQFELTNPYVLLKNMVCSTKKQSIDSECVHNRYYYCGSYQDIEGFLFSSEKFFPSNSLLLYDFSSHQYQLIDKICEENSLRENSQIHSFLFEIPSQLEGKNYENLYLALEDLLKNYSSTHELNQAFKNLSQDQLDRIGGKISYDLDLVTESYYKKIIEPESSVHKASSLPEFLDYYNQYRRLMDIRSFTGGFKGLEISIFQVNYWLETLKRLLLTGEQTQLNRVFDTFIKNFTERIPFHFNRAEFEIMQREVLSLLQSYNDTFRQDQGPYLTVPDRELVEEISKSTDRKASLLSILKQEYAYSSYPLMLSPDVLLSHVLAHSIPDWDNLAQISMIQQEQIFQAKEWEKLIYSVLSELNKSLSNFFTQLYPLQLKESFEDTVADFQDNEIIGRP